jgi:hypothetical protein
MKNAQKPAGSPGIRKRHVTTNMTSPIEFEGFLKPFKGGVLDKPRGEFSIFEGGAENA